MGYCAEVINTEFFIPHEQLEHVLNEIKNFTKGQLTKGIKRIRWADMERLAQCMTVDEQFQEWGWELEVNPDGDVVDIIMQGDKLGDELVLFKAVAPYVRPGSFIEMMGEDGSQWRFVFEDGTCTEVDPEVKYASKTGTTIDVKMVEKPTPDKLHSLK